MLRSGNADPDRGSARPSTREKVAQWADRPSPAQQVGRTGLALRRLAIPLALRGDDPLRGSGLLQEDVEVRPDLDLPRGNAGDPSNEVQRLLELVQTALRADVYDILVNEIGRDKTFALYRGPDVPLLIHEPVGVVLLKAFDLLSISQIGDLRLIDADPPRSNEGSWRDVSGSRPRRSAHGSG